jgi:hypothetical protein
MVSALRRRARHQNPGRAGLGLRSPLRHDPRPSRRRTVRPLARFNLLAPRLEPAVRAPARPARRTTAPHPGGAQTLWNARTARSGRPDRPQPPGWGCGRRSAAILARLGEEPLGRVRGPTSWRLGSNLRFERRLGRRGALPRAIRAALRPSGTQERPGLGDLTVRSRPDGAAVAASRRSSPVSAKALLAACAA